MLDREKKLLRERIWKIMEDRNIARFPRPVFGRIPNFVGSEEAATNLVKDRRFLDAEVVFSNPDAPQRRVREEALRWGKLLIMASPKLRSGFLVLDPGKIPPRFYSKAATIRGAFTFGERVMWPRREIDVKVVGSVAVDREGGRLGKGGGFSDLEYAILREMGLVEEKTPILTTVHPVQVVTRVPMAGHDVPIDEAYTPLGKIGVKRVWRRPAGLMLEKLDKKMVDKIPVLKSLLKERGFK